jgi:hypothetical protein
VNCDAIEELDSATFERNAHDRSSTPTLANPGSSREGRAIPPKQRSKSESIDDL